MKRFLTVIFLIVLGYGFQAKAQSETHDMITYDTTINYVNASNNGQGTGGAHWNVRITRPRNLFTSGNSDTASRRILMSMPGAGEVATGNFTTDTTAISAFGPHYWIKNGWDGSVLLGNGTHYPILITVQQAVANTRPWFTLGLVRILYNEFHPRGGKFDVMGLSQGSYEWG